MKYHIFNNKTTVTVDDSIIKRANSYRRKPLNDVNIECILLSYGIEEETNASSSYINECIENGLLDEIYIHENMNELAEKANAFVKEHYKNESNKTH